MPPVPPPQRFRPVRRSRNRLRGAGAGTEMMGGPAPAPGRGLTRAALLRGAAAVSLGLAAPWALTGCATGAVQGSGPVRPQRASTVIDLVFQPNVQFIPWNPTTQHIFQQFTDEHFNAHHHGLRASIFPAGWGDTQPQIVATLAGKGYADIFMQCCASLPVMEQAGIVAPLDALLREDNIARTQWVGQHLQAATYAGHLYGLPAYDATHCIFYRQDLLDQLGLSYPDPSWTAAEAARIWTAASGTNRDGSHRAGMSFYWGSAWMPFWLRGWGAHYANPDQTRATMDTAQGSAAVGYFVELVRSGVAIPGQQNPQILPAAQAVFAEYHSAHVVDVGVHVLGNSYKWNILPMPLWPVRRATGGGNSSYMLNQDTKHRAAAWTLLKWLTGAEGDMSWPRFQIQISLVTPALLSLWSYWETAVVQVAPVLQGKDLQWFAAPALQDYEYSQVFYRYQPLVADADVNTWLNTITAGHVDVALGLQQMQGQVNALEREAVGQASAQQQARTRFPARGPVMAQVPAGL